MREEGIGGTEPNFWFEIKLVISGALNSMKQIKMEQTWVKNCEFYFVNFFRFEVPLGHIFGDVWKTVGHT